MKQASEMIKVLAVAVALVATAAVGVRAAEATSETVNRMAEAMLQGHAVGPFAPEHDFERTLDRMLSRGMEPTPVVTLDKFHAMHKERLGFSLLEMGESPHSSDPSCKDGHACPIANGLCCPNGNVCCPANNPCVVDEKTKKTTCDESPDMKFLRWKMKDEAKRKAFENDLQQSRDKHEEHVKHHDKKVSEGIVKYHKKQAEEESEKHKKHMEESKKKMAEQEHKHNTDAKKKKGAEELRKKNEAATKKKNKGLERAKKAALRKKHKEEQDKRNEHHKKDLIRHRAQAKANEIKHKAAVKAHEAQVKRNRCAPVRVWSAGFRSGNRAWFNWRNRRVATGGRGFTLVALHPHDNHIIHRRTYDTYASHGRAVQMGRVIQHLPNGARVLIACRDECSRRFHPFLRRVFARNLHLHFHNRIRFRWSYAAIAVKNGGVPFHGRPLEAISPNRGVSIGWRFNCPKGGWIHGLANQEAHQHAAPQKRCANLHVWSRGYRRGGWHDLRVNRYRFAGHGRGFNVLTVHPSTKRVTGRARFDTYGDRNAPNRMAHFLNRQPRGTIILIGCDDECSRHKSGALTAAFRRIGVRYGYRLGFRHSYAAIARKGVRRAIESWPHNNRQVHVGARWC